MLNVSLIVISTSVLYKNHMFLVSMIGIFWSIASQIYNKVSEKIPKTGYYGIHSF